MRLLARSTRRLTPTEAGVAFYERALRAVTEADEADTAARGASASLEGRLRISAAVLSSRIHLVPRLAEFLDVHPRLELELVMDDRPRDLVAENIDAALRLGALTDSSLRAQARAERTPRHCQPRLSRTPRSSRHSCRSPPFQRHHLFAMDRRRGMVLPSRNRRNIHTLSKTADDHRRRRRARRRDQWTGFAIASRWMFAPGLQSGEVVSILNDWTLPPLDLWVIYPSGRLTSTKARAFVKWFEGIIA